MKTGNESALCHIILDVVYLRHMGELLKSQPLVEALCEFQFDFFGDNELILPGLFYAQVKDDFPILTSVNELSFQIGFGDLQNVPPITTPQRLQLARQDSSAMIQLGQSILIVNHLQPYISWEVFRELIIKTFEKYVGLCSVFTLKRIGLRYINHITPSLKEGFKIDDFLTILPLFPKPLDRSMSGFQQTYEFIYDSPSSSLFHKTGIAVKPDGETILVLDLDFISQQVENFQDVPKTYEWLIEWLNKAHDHIEAAFISSLNPSYYESLK